MNTLNNIPGKNPFKVPENYFDDLNSRILSKTIKQGAAPRLAVHRNFRHYLAIAASFAGFIILGLTTIHYFNEKGKATAISEVVGEGLMETIINDVDITTLEESMIEPGTGGISAEVGSSDIIDHLILEDIELSEIYERL